MFEFRSMRVGRAAWLALAVLCCMSSGCTTCGHHHISGGLFCPAAAKPAILPSHSTGYGYSPTIWSPWPFQIVDVNDDEPAPEPEELTPPEPEPEPQAEPGLLPDSDDLTGHSPLRPTPGSRRLPPVSQASFDEVNEGSHDSPPSPRFSERHALETVPADPQTDSEGLSTWWPFPGGRTRGAPRAQAVTR